MSRSASNPIGIYQGTALGPLLFSIFSNDKYLHVPDAVKIAQYSDDTQLMVSDPEERTAGPDRYSRSRA